MKQIALLCFLLGLFLVCNAQDTIVKDKHLQILINEALENNSDVRVSQLSVQQAETMIRCAKLTYTPSFALAPSSTISKAQGLAPTKSYTLPITMEWELNFGGSHKAGKQIAKAQFEESKEQLRYSKIQLVAAIANAYYTLIMLDRQLVITQESIENQEQSLKTLRAYKEVGKMTELAVNESEAIYQNTKVSVLELEMQIEKVENALLLLVNRNSGNIERSTWNEAVDFVMPNGEVDMSQLSSRPDVKAAEQALLAACGNVKVASASLYPAIRISADLGWTNYIGEVVNPEKILLNVVGSIIQSIFNHGENKARKEIAISQQKQAEITFEKALLTAGVEVKEALVECSKVSEKQTIRQQYVELSKKAYENSQSLLAYSQSVSYLDVLTAQKTYLTAQLEQISDWMEMQQANINLYKALCPSLY